MHTNATMNNDGKLEKYHPQGMAEVSDRENDNREEEEEVQWEVITAAGFCWQFTSSSTAASIITPTQQAKLPPSAEDKRLKPRIMQESETDGCQMLYIGYQNVMSIITPLQQQLAEKDEMISSLQENIESGFWIGRKFERESKLHPPLNMHAY